jgi:hypothetical protein
MDQIPVLIEKLGFKTVPEDLYIRDDEDVAQLFPSLNFVHPALLRFDFLLNALKLIRLSSASKSLISSPPHWKESSALTAIYSLAWRKVSSNPGDQSNLIRVFTARFVQVQYSLARFQVLVHLLDCVLIASRGLI